MNLQNAGRIDEIGCDVFRDGHVDFVDDLLSPFDMARFQVHVDECEPCARYDRVVRRSQSLVREMTEVEPSEDFELRLQHRLFHLQDERSLETPRAFSGAATLAVTASLALLAWSPLVLRDDSASDAALAGDAEAPSAIEAQFSDPLFQGAAVWYPAPVSAPAPTAMLAAFPGPYSPLVVQPPVHRAARTVSSEYGPLD